MAEKTTTLRMNLADFVRGEAIGNGSFSKVYSAIYKPENKEYAMKVVLKSDIFSAPTEAVRNRLAMVNHRERDMLLMCDHPNILRIYATMQSETELIFITEICKGGELQHCVQRRGAIPLKAARHVAAELFSAVSYLHRGEKRTVPSLCMNPKATILHRDIKPENIMLTEDRHVKLIDFGTAIICDEKVGLADPTASGGRAQTFCGTTHYMSPELLKNTYTCTASDYWACGCVLYFMLVGHRPFEGNTPYILIKNIMEKPPSFPDDIDSNARDLIERLLIKNPSDRIGLKDIVSHPFFEGIPMDNLKDINPKEFWIENPKWLPDTDVVECMECSVKFSTFKRRHHCRWCGKVFCSACTSLKRNIPDSYYTTAQRVCTRCSDILE